MAERVFYAPEAGDALDAFIGQKVTDALTTGHNHDTRYYTESEVDTKLATKADLAGGKVPLSQLPNDLLGRMTYQGVWNAATNSPDLANLAKSKGYYWVVSTAGTTLLGGKTDWQPKDWVVYNGSGWDAVDNTDSVTGFRGRLGNITPQAGDYAAALIGLTPTGDIAATNVQDAIAELGLEKQPAGTYVKKVNDTAPDANGNVTISASGGGSGTTFLSGSGAPSNALGANGDYYRDTQNAREYGPKASGSWPSTYRVMGNVRSVNGVAADSATGDVVVPASTLPSYATIAALTAATGRAVGDLVRVEGYFAKEDGGGGTFEKVSATATSNQGTIFACADGAGFRWIRRDQRIGPDPASPRYINARWFGARGTYNAATRAGDLDTAAFQRIVNAAEVSRGCQIEVPAGNYALDGAEGVITPMNLHSFGFVGPETESMQEGGAARCGATFILTTPKMVGFTVRKGATSVALKGPRFRNIHFLGATGESVPTTRPIVATLTNRGRITDCTFENVLTPFVTDSLKLTNAGDNPAGFNWTPSTRKHLFWRVWALVSGTYYSYEVIDVGSATTWFANTGTTEPVWPTATGATVADGPLTWRCVGPMQTGGDGAWWELKGIHVRNSASGPYVPHSGCIIWESGTVEAFGATEPGAVCFPLHGGNFHRINTVKMENAEKGIELYGGYCIVDEVVCEDVATPVHVGKNAGVSSGAKNSIGKVLAQLVDTPTAAGAATFYGIKCDTGTSGYIDPGYQFSPNYTSAAKAGGEVVLPGTGWKVGGGAAGTAGATPGAVMRYGTAAPTNAVGDDGDYFEARISQTDIRIYGPKASGAWPGTYAVRQTFASRIEVEAEMAAGTNTAIPTGTAAVVSLGTETLDTDSAFASSTFTAPRAGYYEFHAEFAWATNTTNAAREYRLRINAGLGTERDVCSDRRVTRDTAGAVYTPKVKLAAGDTVKLVASQASGAALDLTTAKLYIRSL